MKISKWMAVPLAVSLFAAPSPASAQVNLSVRFGTRLGPDVSVFAYSPERHGDWRANYRTWTPVTLYDVNGRYYRNSVPGARAVAMYSYNGEFFLPPTDEAWVNMDRRYHYDHRPVDVDRGRVSAYVAVGRPDARLGAEIGVFGYTPDRAGDWHRNYRNWTPTTVYEFNGRYYQHAAPGARAVQIYRYQNEYFLPPRDGEWVNRDKRFDYGHRPSDEDYKRAHERP
jgi:hypothetical protein